MSKYNDYLEDTYKRIGLKASKTSNISLQCINKKSLEAIDRPEIDWDIHKEMIKEFGGSREYGHSYLIADLILDIHLWDIMNISISFVNCTMQDLKM